MLYPVAIAGAVIGSIATWTILAHSHLLIWSIFIAWAGFLHAGGNGRKVATVLFCYYFGTLLAWIFSLILVSATVPIATPVLAGAMVAIVIPIIVFASTNSLLGIPPACFYGFASSFAFLTQTPGKMTIPSMESISLNNVLVIVPLSMTVGVLLGVFHVALATKIAERRTSSPA